MDLGIRGKKHWLLELVQAWEKVLLWLWRMKAQKSIYQHAVKKD